MKNSKNTSVSQILQNYLKTKKNLQASIYKATNVPQVTKVPLGIIAFDYLTAGGIPINRITQFYGNYSSGKTTLSLICADKFIKTFPNKEVVFFDFEGAFDKNWANLFIDNLDKIIVVSPTCGEDGLEIMLSLIQKNAPVSLFIIDSLASIIPMAELNESMHDQQIGLQARLVAKFYRKFVIESSKSENDFTLLVLNQVRANIGAPMFSSPTKPATGYSTGHFCSLIVKMASKQIHKVGDTPVKQTFSIFLEKSKVGGFIKKKVDFSLALMSHNGYNVGDICESKQIFTLAKTVGLDIKKLTKTDTLKQAEAVLSEDAPLRDKIKKEIYKILWERNI